MPNTNSLEQITADEWKAAPPSLQTLLMTLLPLADEVAELRERVALLENSRSLSSVAEDAAATPELHPYAEIFGTYGGPIWNEIFDEIECERAQEITKENIMQIQLTAVYQKVPEGYIGFVEELPGANTQGDTLEETRTNLQEAITLVLEANRALAKEALNGQDVIRETVLVSAA